MQNDTARFVTKANGERELFFPEKLHRSLVQSGADFDVADRITSDVASSIHEGDKTRDIYKIAFQRLRQVHKPLAARYSVKHALLELGPSGYPFEDFLSEMYKILGYTSLTRVIVQGCCIEHEMDIVAVKGNKRIAAEIKYHNNPGLKSDIKVALYVKARFEDIAAQSVKGGSTDYTDTLLITNTKFTKQVEVYAACAGLQLISWDYPSKGNLREMIEETKVHPVSCLTSLSKGNKRRLMDQGIVLCKQLPEQIDKVYELGLSDKMVSKLMEEIKYLC